MNLTSMAHTCIILMYIKVDCECISYDYELVINTK